MLFVYRRKKARVFLKYAASGAYIDYEFIQNKAEGKIGLSVKSKHERAKLRVLLPAGAENARAKTSSKLELPSKIENVQGSNYIVFDNFKTPQDISIEYDLPVGVLPVVTIGSDNVHLYIVNRSDKSVKCKIDFTASGYKTVEPREFTLGTGERNMEIMSLVAVPKDGSPMRVELEVNGNRHSYPVSL